MGAVLFTGLAWSVSAQQSQLAQTIQPLVADVCPNIPGEQSTLPDGMRLMTPTATATRQPLHRPTPPRNRRSIYASILPVLRRHYRQDIIARRRATVICSRLSPNRLSIARQNLDGVQAAVPEGHFLTPNNTCLVRAERSRCLFKYSRRPNRHANRYEK